MKKNTAVLGLWNFDNYGSVLTAYGLYNFLERGGYGPVLIDYLPRNLNTKTGNFIRTRVRTTEPITESKELRRLNESFDTFLVGADQNWKSNFLWHYKGFPFFLNFVEDDKRKISYSTSFADTKYEASEWETRLIEKYLQQFDALSVREQKSAIYYKEKLGRNVEWVIDPIFFTSFEEYKGLSEDAKRVSEGPYALGFFLDLTSKKVALLEKTALQKNINARCCLGADYTNNENVCIDDFYKDMSVEEVLNLINNAEVVITDSYHITCLSIIMHKPFITISNEYRGNERFLSLLGRMNLINQLINEKCFDSVSFDTDIFDWSMTDHLINEWKNESQEWLLKHMKGEKAGITMDKDLMIEDLANRLSVQEREIEILKDKCDGLFKGFYELDRLYKAAFDVLETNPETYKPLIDKRENIMVSYICENINEGEKIAIRCGGYHTERLLPSLLEAFKQKNVTLLYIVDINTNFSYKIPEETTGITTQEFYDNRVKDVDAVIVSTSRYKKELCDEVKEKTTDGKVRVINPYDAFGPDELREKQGWYEIR